MLTNVNISSGCIGLNPYSGGKCIPINHAFNGIADLLLCLNPYSGGKCIPIIVMKVVPSKDRTKSLNPYSGGKCIPIAVKEVTKFSVWGLNPYSGGKCIPIIKTVGAVKSDLTCLNPYSGGKCIPICPSPQKGRIHTKRSQSLFRW